MPKILSLSNIELPVQIEQAKVVDFVQNVFTNSIKDLDRYLHVFENGLIKKRQFVKNLEWYNQDHPFSEKNKTYIESAVKYGAEAINQCLHNQMYLKQPIPYADIDAIFFISSTGIATPSIDARIMNVLPLHSHVKRIPIWGLGCAGGAAGLSRAFEYCKAFSHSKVLLLAVEFCSLTFQQNDFSKSNLIGMSLFSDGVSCACIVGDDVDVSEYSGLEALPMITSTDSILKADSLDVMGWDVKDDGLYVIFSKNIPRIIQQWLQPNMVQYLNKFNLTVDDIKHFILHPGGKKVIEAYEQCLSINRDKTDLAFQILKQYGNMSSATILYVLNQFMLKKGQKGDLGIMAALGPGFSLELLLLKWE